MTKRALIVDDDSDVRSTISMTLQAAGWEVVEVRNGEEAIVVASREYPDLIVLDVMMPRMTGFETLKQLREDDTTDSIPVIMLTAVNDFELGQHHDAENIGQRLGVPAPEAFLEKPLSPKEFLKAVETIFEERL